MVFTIGRHFVVVSSVGTSGTAYRPDRREGFQDIETDGDDAEVGAMFLSKRLLALLQGGL